MNEKLAALLPVLWGLGKEILQISLVHRAIENYFAGTATKWDDRAWAVFEKYAGIASPTARAAKIEDGLQVVQAVYDTSKAKVAAGVPPEQADVDAIAEHGGHGVMPWMDAAPAEG